MSDNSDVLVENEERNKSMIDEFLASKKPSTTFIEQNMKHKIFNEKQIKIRIKATKADEEKLEEYIKKREEKEKAKDTSKKEEKPKEIRTIEHKEIKFPCSMASYKPKMSKKETLIHFTDGLSKVFKSLGYVKKKKDRGVANLYESEETLTIADNVWIMSDFNTNIKSALKMVRKERNKIVAEEIKKHKNLLMEMVA